MNTGSGDVAISKTQRWLDLIAFLVKRRLPVAVDEIMEAVPSYAEKWRAGSEKDRKALHRMFERDKDELREIGVPIDSVPYTIDYGAEKITGYRLAATDFYLPYLRLLRDAGGAQDSDAGGGSPAGEIEVPREEATAALEALNRVAELPASPFADASRSALRKLAYDLDLDGLPAAPVFYLDPPGADVRDEVRALLDAVRSRKKATFTYHGIYRDETTERTVAPYGLLHHHGHWYLVGHDDLRDDLRVFRLGRMEDLAVNSKAMKTADYQVPDDFDIADFAGRRAWELGDDADPVTARVRFAFPTSLLADRNSWGTLAEQHADGAAVREFTVHQVDPFLRWVLGQAGDASVVGPEALRVAYQEMVERVAALYSDPGDSAEEAGS